MFFIPLCYSQITNLTVKPRLTNKNINSFFVQVLELNIPPLYKVSDVTFQPVFTNRYRPFFVCPLSTSAKQTNFNVNKKSYNFNNIQPGKHTFRIKSDWEYEDTIEVYIFHERDFMSAPESNDTVIHKKDTNEWFVFPYLIIPISILLIISIVSTNIHYFMVISCFIVSFSVSFTDPNFIMILNIGNNDNRLYALSYPIEKPDDKWAYYDDKALVQALNSKLDYSKCRLCDFKPAKIPKYGSTERDAIFEFSYGSNYDYLGLISARTAGFKGKMFVFSEKPISDRLKDCGVYQIPITVNLHSEYYHWNIRFPIMYQVLEKHAKDFDRIVYADAGDTFFQADPFDFTDNSLQVSDEQFPLVKDGCTTNWFAQFPGFSMDYFDPTHNLTCTGLFGGSADVLYKITQVVSAFWIEGERGLADQSVYDFVLESNISKKIGIKVKVNPDLETRGIELYRRAFDQDWPVNPLGKFHNARTGFYAAVIHQTNRRMELHNLFRKQCS